MRGGSQWSRLVTFVAVAVTTLSSTRLLISDQICFTLDPEIPELVESLTGSYKGGVMGTTTFQ